MKSFSSAIFLGLALTLACLGLFVLRPRLVEDVSGKVYDALLRRRPAPPQTGRVTMVDLDDRALETFGQWPWPRYLVARLTSKLLAANPAVIGFDIVFAEPDRASPAAVRDDIEREFGVRIDLAELDGACRDYDAMFARVLRSGPIVLGCAMQPGAEGEPPPPDANDSAPGGSRLFAKGAHGTDPDALAAFLPPAGKMTVPIPVLRREAAMGFFNATPDADNIVRSSPLIWADGTGKLYPSLALEAVRLDRGASQCIMEYSRQGIERLRLGDLDIPCDRAGRLIVNYRTIQANALIGFASSFPTFSAADILTDAVDPAALAGKILFVGTSAAGLRDIKATPLTEMFSGVEVHATLVDNILAGDVLRLPNYMAGVQAAAILLAGLSLTVLVAKGRSWLSFALAAAAVPATVALSLWLLHKHHVVFDPTWILATIGMTYPALTTLRFWQEERQKRKVRTMFGTMVSREVLQYLELHPDSFSLTGHKSETTMFFSDIAGFTTLSERLDPERLTCLLNRYLTPMTDIIIASGGYVDKYEGDAIMAEWGVPFALADHAARACLAAIEQQQKLAELRPQLQAEFGCELRVRMGINTGIVTAGNMGSENRFSFTVIGDAVNLAARLEPAAKDYGVQILISEYTFQAARERVEARLLDKLVVAGKSAPVSIYELLGRAGETPPTKRTVVALYEDALRLHWERRWDEARARLREALALDPEDGPSLHLSARIDGYRLQPPPPGWTGERIRAAKD